jgi:tetratricopeptide (TPR) repeat protein
MNEVPVGREVRCPACGATYDASLPDGLCARCLLTFALEDEFGAGKGEPDSKAGSDDAAPGVHRRIGRYQLREEIDRGGVGIVYRAWQADLKREVALKMLLPARIETTDSLNRFRREAELMAGLDHPGILPVYEVGEHDGVPYYSMKLAEGGNLATHIPALRGKFSECARLVAVLARAINYAHGRGVLHRDLKPSNIVFDAGGQCMVTDFGLARRLAVDSSLTGIDALIGTPRYVAPEVLTTPGAQLTAAADVYGLGAIFYELLSGRAPFADLTPVQILQQIAVRRPRAPRQFDETIPAELEAICLRCLEKRPGDRYASADALAHALERWLTLPARGAARWRDRLAVRPLPSRRRVLMRVFAIGCALVLAAIALSIELARRAGPPVPDPRVATRTLVVLPIDLPTPPPAELAAARALSARLQGTQPLNVAAIEPALERARATDFPSSDLQRGMTLGALVQVQVLAVDASPLLRVRAIDVLRDDLLWQGQANAADIDGLVHDLGAALEVSRRTPTPETELPRAALAALARGAELFSHFDETANDAAIDAFKQAIAIDARFALLHARLARAYSQRGFRFGGAAFWLDSAIEEAERAARLDPTLGMASKALGYAYYAKGWWQRSTEAYQHALALGAFDTDLPLNYYAVSRFDESFRLYRRSLDFATHNSMFAYLAAQVLFALGASDASEHWMRIGITREPHAGKRRLMEAEIASHRGDYARCRALADGLDPDLVSGGFGSAGGIERNCAEHVRDWPAALASLEHEKQHYANGTGDLGNSGPELEEAVLLVQLGRDVEVAPLLARARRSAQAAIDGDSEDPEKFLGMATALRLGGDTDAAYRMLDRAFTHGLTINASNDGSIEFVPFQKDARFAELRKASLAKVAEMRERVEKTLSAEDIDVVSLRNQAIPP